MLHCVWPVKAHWRGCATDFGSGQVGASRTPSHSFETHPDVEIARVVCLRTHPYKHTKSVPLFFNDFSYNDLIQNKYIYIYIYIYYKENLKCVTWKYI